MSDDELLCRRWNRDLWHALRAGEVTREEAVFLARRTEFHATVDTMLPDLAVKLALNVYDLLFEPDGEADSAERSEQR